MFCAGSLFDVFLHTPRPSSPGLLGRGARDLKEVFFSLSLSVPRALPLSLPLSLARSLLSLFSANQKFSLCLPHALSISLSLSCSLSVSFALSLFLQDYSAEVQMDGGSLTIKYPPPGCGDKDEGHVFMTGRYDLAYTGVIPASLWN